MIIIDLAKKWIFAEDSYSGAGRRGSYSLPNDEDNVIAYEFSDKWQFVAEAKWFNYLWSCNLQPYSAHETPVSEIEPDAAPARAAHQEHMMRREQDLSGNDFASILEPTSEGSTDEDDGDEMWDEERAGIEIEFANRWTRLVDFEPRNAAEARDRQTLEHILRYEQKAAVARHQIHLMGEEIAALRIELQAVENLWDRTADPRWEIKRTYFQTRIAQQEKHILRLTDEQDEFTAMAAELRTLRFTRKFHQMLKYWTDGVRHDRPDREKNIPF